MITVGNKFPLFQIKATVRRTDLNVGRNPQEVLRVLDALQTACTYEKKVF